MLLNTEEAHGCSSFSISHFYLSVNNTNVKHFIGDQMSYSLIQFILESIDVIFFGRPEMSINQPNTKKQKYKQDVDDFVRSPI